jgi:ADP-ribose pyrophosphatase YjhB (NUDIX family)
VCAIVKCDEKILLVRRAQAPGKGLLDFPGGFVDYKESNEQALRRELQEELHLPVTEMRYLFSSPNEYLYKDVLYSTLDSFFEVLLDTQPNMVLQTEEVSEYGWYSLSDIDLKDLAFESGQRAIASYVAIKKG